MMIDNSYLYTTINDPFAVYSTYGNAINAGGQVAGQYVDSNGVSHAVLYKNGKYTVLNDPLATATAAVGNDNCQIVGQQYADSSAVAQSFLYSKVAYGNGHFTTLDDPLADPAQGGTAVNGINDNGQIVGDYADSNGVSHGFLYSDGKFTTLDDPHSARPGHQLGQRHQQQRPDRRGL